MGPRVVGVSACCGVLGLFSPFLDKESITVGFTKFCTTGISDVAQSVAYLVFHIKINDDSCDLLFNALFISLDPKHDSLSYLQIQSKD